MGKVNHYYNASIPFICYNNLICPCDPTEKGNKRRQTGKIHRSIVEGLVHRCMFSNAFSIFLTAKRKFFSAATVAIEIRDRVPLHNRYVLHKLSAAPFSALAVKEPPS